ncbi:MAG: DUF1844 domain-containing protein [Archangium sp.]|nr:DUF1844 domain-containing protein [Archangium sp.]
MPTTGETFTMQQGGETLTFSAFVLGLASSALIHLGVHQNPETGVITVDLTLARQSIDVLALLREKTRGNLSAEEEQLFSSVLSDLRLRFVEKSNTKA